MNHVVALSGGKDSTALALRLLETEPRDYTYLCTPTGDELPELIAHWSRLESILGRQITYVRARSDLNQLITEFGALPNWRQRWCTRLLKIEPCKAYLLQHQPATLYVGLRADEEEREGLYGPWATYRYPLREWGWGIAEVRDYIKKRGVKIPERTDCARCYGQRLVEWKRLLRKHPAVYASAEAQEAATGHTFRSPGRDSWPAPLAEVRAEIERGRRVRGENLQMPLFGDDDLQACRVCRL